MHRMNFPMKGAELLRGIERRNADAATDAAIWVRGTRGGWVANSQRNRKLLKHFVIHGI